MYHHCLYCAADLGTNQVIEEFQVGRRLAFDPARGRLWVVCRACERWNLSPLEERWEALEALERLYRDTHTRVSTENIGLARVPEGLELVRVGRPRRPEFAAWRYGDQFGRRRRQFIVTTGIGLGVATGLGLGSAAIAGVSALLLPLQLLNLTKMALDKKLPGARIPVADEDEPIVVTREELGMQRIRPSDEYDEGWYLDLSPPGRSDRGILTGTPAVTALSMILPKLNRQGAGKNKVQEAVSYIEEAGHPDAFFRQVEHFARKQGLGYNPIRGLPKELRLGLEMAANEDQERAALEGELRLLEAAWQQAEELAAIADSLLTPNSIHARLHRLRQGRL